MQEKTMPSYIKHCQTLQAICFIIIYDVKHYQSTNVDILSIL